VTSTSCTMGSTAFPCHRPVVFVATTVPAGTQTRGTLPHSIWSACASHSDLLLAHLAGATSARGAAVHVEMIRPVVVV
jgi:hypothetical protein